MPVRIQNRRFDPRNRIPELQDAEVEVRMDDGTTQRFPLIELSASGGSFRLNDRRPEFAPGVVINEARIRVGAREIQAHFEVLHVSLLEGSAYACGARIYPATEKDHNELMGLVSRLADLDG